MSAATASPYGGRLLVTGAKQTISKALGNAEGWRLSAETKTPPPSTREKILKPPSE